MKTAAIKVKTYVNNVNVMNDDFNKRMFKNMLFTLGALALVYVFVVGSTIFNIVERKSLENQARTLSSEVSDLELTYLAMASKIDLEYSHSLGFKEAKAKFATRKSLGSLGFVHNEI